MKERKIGKINRNGSILKLRDDTDESQYILCWMSLDIVFMTFYSLSTWNLKYYLESDVSVSNNNYLKGTQLMRI
jgi:hypothetical protein